MRLNGKEVENGLDQCFELALWGRGSCDSFANQRIQLPAGARQQGQVQFVLVLEIAIDGAFADPGHARHVVHANFVKALCAEQVCSGLQHALGLFGFLGAHDLPTCWTGEF